MDIITDEDREYSLSEPFNSGWIWGYNCNVKNILHDCCIGGNAPITVGFYFTSLTAGITIISVSLLRKVISVNR